MEIWGGWQAKQISEGKTEVDLRLKAEGMEEEELKRQTLNGFQEFCKEIGKRCEIEK